MTLPLFSAADVLLAIGASVVALLCCGVMLLSMSACCSHGLTALPHACQSASA